MSDDLPERAEGALGESAGATLMRALDNIGRLEADEDGGKVVHLVIAYAVAHPPSEDHPFGSHTYGWENTPGAATHETIGLLRFIERAALNDDD